LKRITPGSTAKKITYAKTITYSGWLNNLYTINEINILISIIKNKYIAQGKARLAKKSCRGNLIV